MKIHIRRLLITTICIIPSILLSCASQPVNNAEKIILKVQRSGLSLLPVIYTITVTGDGEIAIRYPPRLGDHPEWSPDGRWIVFDTSYAIGGDSTIYVMRADGKRKVQILNHRSTGFRPTWSPDGAKIAYFSRGAQAGIYILNVDCILRDDKNCNFTPSFFAQGDFPDWSPDGNYIVYLLFGHGLSKDKILIKNLVGLDEPIDITPSNVTYCNNPRWSPDGTKIVVSCDANIYVMNADGTNVRQLTTSQNGGNAEPTWSSDGTRIVFISTRDGLGECIGGLCGSGGVYSDAIFSMNSDGTDTVRISLRNDESVLWYELMP